MRLALDTNRYADLQRGEADVVYVLQHAAAIYLPLVVLGELRAGFLGGNRAAANEQILATFLGRANIHVLAPDEATTDHYAALFNQLRRNATPIPTNDLWIAALVVQHDLTLYSRDAHFDRVPQLRRL